MKNRRKKRKRKRKLRRRKEWEKLEWEKLEQQRALDVMAGRQDPFDHIRKLMSFREDMDQLLSPLIGSEKHFTGKNLLSLKDNIESEKITGKKLPEPWRGIFESDVD